MSKVSSHCDTLAEAQELAERLTEQFPDWDVYVVGFKDGKLMDARQAVRADNAGERVDWFVVREKKELRGCPKTD